MGARAHSVVAGWHVDKRDGLIHHLNPWRGGQPERDFVFKAGCGIVIYPENRGRRRKAPTRGEMLRMAPSTGCCPACMESVVYPEHAIRRRAGEAPEIVARFLGWLEEQDYVIAQECVMEQTDDRPVYDAVHRDTRHWVADYLGIDAEAFDAETEQMLRTIREAQS